MPTALVPWGKDLPTWVDLSSSCLESERSTTRTRAWESVLIQSRAFIKGVRESLPKAEVTFDRFHVAKVLGDAVERVRRSEWRKDKTVKGARYALLKNPENLTDCQRETLTEITKRNAALAEVYRMKETFRDLYRLPDLRSATGFLKGWLAVAMTSTLKPVVKAAKTINNRAEGILRW
ncbi:MAG: transposase [Planctomycetes bacterium]|nr:transposase [Planctomycetota bacterium]